MVRCRGVGRDRGQRRPGVRGARGRAAWRVRRPRQGGEGWRDLQNDEVIGMGSQREATPQHEASSC